MAGTGQGIQSNLASSLEARALFSQKESALEPAPVSFDVQTNLCGIEGARSAHAQITSVLADIKAALLADAGHIGEMGESFVRADKALAAQIESCL